MILMNGIWGISYSGSPTHHHCHDDVNDANDHQQSRYDQINVIQTENIPVLVSCCKCPSSAFMALC